MHRYLMGSATLQPALNYAGITSPLVGHVTLVGFASGASRNAVTAVVTDWARSTLPITLAIEALDVFGLPNQIVIARMLRSDKLVNAFIALAGALSHARLPSLIPRAADEWIFHMSIAYCGLLSALAWQSMRPRCPWTSSHRRVRLCTARNWLHSTPVAGRASSSGVFALRG
jgi:2'-5' RNA ligase superfamily